MSSVVPFTVGLHFTAEEIAEYQRAIRARRPSPTASSFLLIGSGIGLSLLIGFVLAATNSVPRSDGALIAAALFLCYWIGIWMPSLGTRGAMRQYLLDQKNLTEEALQSVELSVTSTAVEFRRPYSHGVWQRNAIIDTTLEGGLLLLWLRTGSALPIPAHLLTEDQVNYLVSFGKGSP